MGPYPLTVTKVMDHAAVYGVDVVSDRRWSGRPYAVRSAFTLYRERTRSDFKAIIDRMVSYQYSKIVREIARFDLNIIRHYRRHHASR